MLGNYLVYYDFCSMCRTFRNFVTFFDFKNHLTTVSIADAASLGLLGGLPPSEHYKSFHLVVNDGRIFSAGTAIPILIGLLLNSKSISNSISGSKSLTFMMEGIYNLFAKAKHNLNCGNICRTKKAQ